MDRELKNLYQDLQNKKQIFASVGMRNVNGLSIDEAFSLDSRYEEAKTDYFEAEETYRNAQHLSRGNGERR